MAKRSREWEEPFVALETDDELAEWLGRAGPVVLFLHDPWCPISAAAFREMARLPAPIGLIDVSASGGLSETVEERTGVRHESPQAIVLRAGEAVWSESHFQIREDAVGAALRASGAERAE